MPKDGCRGKRRTRKAGPCHHLYMSWDVLIPPAHSLVLLRAVPHLRVPALKLKQAKGPLPALPVLPGARSVRPSQFDSRTVLLCDPPAGLNEYYSQYKVGSKSVVGRLSVKDQTVKILHFAGCTVSLAAT